MKKKLIIIALFVFGFVLIISLFSIDLVKDTTQLKPSYELPQSVKSQIKSEVMGLDECPLKQINSRYE